MKRIFCLLLSIAVMTMWCLPGFATQETIGPTGSPWTSDATGSLSGYFINNGGTAYTLNVTAGFPDIFTANSGGGHDYTLPAVSTNNASLSSIVFDSNPHNVYGTIGTGAAFADITLTAAAAVNFDGTVNTTTMHVATGTADFKSGNSNNAAITFTGDGTVTLDANTTVIGAITNQGTQQGTLNLNSASILNGAVGGTTGLKAINVGVAPGIPGSPISATITGAVKTYLINLYNNILNIGGALTVAPNGVINTTVNSNTEYGKVVTTGAVTIGAGTVINETINGSAHIIAATSIVSNYTAPITIATTINGGTLTPTSNTTLGSLNGNGAINLATGGGVTLTTGTLNTTDSYTGVINGTGGALTKVGTGTLTLSGTNTYTGLTTVDSGGTLALDFSAAGAPATNIIGNVGGPTALELDGGTLLLKGGSTVPNSQTFSGLTLSPGDSYITLTTNATPQDLLLTLGAITQQHGGMVNFTQPTTALSGTNGITTSTGNTNGILGAWATVGSGGSLKYAYWNGTDIAAYTTATTATAADLSNMLSATTNYKYAAATTLAGNQTGNTLQYTGGATTTALGGNSLTLNGLMNSGTGLLTITGTGAAGLVTGANNELDIISNTWGINISSVISGAGAVVYGGPSAGTLTLSGTNIYTGGTFLNEGTLVANNTQALGTIASALSISGGTLDLATDTSTTAYNTTITGNATIDSDKATGASAGITQTLGTLHIGADTLTVGKGGNVGSGTAGLTFGATTLTDTGAVFAPAVGTLLTLGAVSGAGNSFTVNGAGNTDITGIIGTGTGAVTQSGAGTLTLSGANTYSGATTINAGTLQVENPQALGIGSAVTVGTGGTLSLGTTNLALGTGSSYTQGGNGTLNLTANSSSSYGNITTPGVVTTAATNTVNVAVGGYIPNGAVLSILNGGGIAGAAPTVTSNNPYMTFSDVFSGNNLVLTANRSGSNSFAGAASNSNAANVGNVLDNITNPSADMFNILTALGNLSSSQVATAESSMSPTNDGAITQSAIAMAYQFTDNISSRLENIRTTGGATGISTGDGYLKGANVWGQGLGDYAHEGPRGVSNGYNATTWGASAGIDKTFFNDSNRIGICSGYGQTYVNSKDFSGTTDIGSVPITLYYGYNDANHPFYLDAAATFAYNTYDGSRQIVVGPTGYTAKADYNGEQYSGYIEGGYSFFYKALSLTPLVSFDYMHLHVGNYTETGAGALNLQVNSQDYDMAQTGIGAKAAYPLDLKCGALIPDLHFKWLYDWVGDKEATTASFAGGGASFGTNGFAPAQSGYDFGTKVTFKTKYNISIDLQYDFLFKADYYEHTGTVAVKYSF